MSRLTSLMAGVVLAAATGIGSAQDQPVLEKRRSTVEAIKSVRRYPLDVRRAVPVVAQHPKLPRQLLGAVHEDNPKALDEVLAEYPKAVQDAGRLLARSPEVLEIMVALPDVTKAVGDIYAKEGEEGLRKRIEGYLKESPGTQEAVVAWTRRLSANRPALNEYLDAVTELMEEKPGGEHCDYGCGINVTPNKVSVYDLPPAVLTAFVLAHADDYPHLADEMLEQWLQTKSEDDFDQVVALWWGLARQFFKPELLHPEGRAERLAELATLAKQYGVKMNEPPPTPAQAWKFLNEHKNELPLSAKHLLSEAEMVPPLKEGEVVAKPKVPARPKPVVTVVTPKKPTRVAAAKPKPRPERAPVPQTVTREDPSREQQVRGASQSNYYYWYWYQQPAPYFFYNPYYYRWPVPRQPVFGRPIRGRR